MRTEILKLIDQGKKDEDIRAYYEANGFEEIEIDKIMDDVSKIR